MPVLADIEMARDIILPALTRFADKTLKLQGLLHSGAPLREIRVDDLQSPRAVLIKQGSFYSMSAEDPECAKHLLTELNWQWSNPLGFAGVPEEFVDVIASFADIEWSQPCYQYHLPRDVSLAPLREIVDGVASLGTVGAQYADQVLAYWPYGEQGNPEDQRFIARRLETGFSVGFYDEGELVAWALTGDDLSMGMMHTLETHRRQGIAAKVTSQLTLALCEEHITPYCYVVAGNEPPLGLLTQLGYVQGEGRYFWLGTKPKTGRD